MIGDLPDANVWVALTSAEHAHHSRAVRYWKEEALGPVAFCRTTALGLVRVVSGKHSVGGVPLPFEKAWARYLAWRADPEIVFSHEPSGVDGELGRLVKENLVTSKNSTDAYLAAFAISASLRLVSFDSDFERFTGLDLLRL